MSSGRYYTGKTQVLGGTSAYTPYVDTAKDQGTSLP